MKLCGSPTHVAPRSRISQVDSVERGMLPVGSLRAEVRRNFITTTVRVFVPACQNDLAQRPRRCAQPGRFVAADSPGNPPIRRVDPSLSASAMRHLRLPDRSGGHGPGHRRAGRFVQLRKERRW